MKLGKIPWMRVAVLLTELVLIGAAVAFPLIITDTTLQTTLRILELVAGIPQGGN